MKKLLLLPILLITGCVTTSPKIDTVETTKVFDEPFNEVWSAVIIAFAKNHLPIKTIDREKGVLFAKDIEPRLDWFDCGPKKGEVSLKLNFYIKESYGQTKVDMNVSYYKRVVDIKIIGYSESIICDSTGVLEYTLWDEIENNLN